MWSENGDFDILQDVWNKTLAWWQVLFGTQMTLSPYIP